MRWSGVVAVALLVAGGTLAGTVVRAIPRMQKEAKALGFPANDCKYCHSFDTAHMQQKARALGINNMNCGGCHGRELPRIGKGLFNERGQWLVDEKRRRQVEKVDVAWLAKHGGSPKEPALK